MITEFESLKPHNTFGVSAQARYFSAFKSIDELRELLEHHTVRENPRLVLGGGSNMLFVRNFDGIVIKNELKGIETIAEDEHHYYVKSAAGEVWHELVMHCIQANYAGLENLALIPGCVGASPMQNIGAYGVEIKDVFHSLEAIHIADGSMRVFTLEECKFGYRESIFKREQKDQWVIASVTFRLNKRPVLHTTYGAIEEELDKMHLDNISIKDVAKAVINIRSSKLPDPKKIGNAGSFFKNPVVPMEVYRKIQEHHNNAPCFPIDEDHVKVPAGWLIERAGWKGKNMGNYGVHDKQALVLVNYGGATGNQIYDLSTSIIEDIKQKFGIELEREVNIIR
jgi:UDP-N-acetylmuramate dehydrogenase